MAAPPHRTSIPPAPTRIQVQELLVEAVATVILCSVLVGFFFVLIAVQLTVWPAAYAIKKLFDNKRLKWLNRIL